MLILSMKGEEVLQYLYEKYGRDRAGMTNVVTCYRMRSAVQEVGKHWGSRQTWSANCQESGWTYPR